MPVSLAQVRKPTKISRNKSW